MGCFLGCFGSSKDECKRRKNTQTPSHRNPEIQNVRNQYNPVLPTSNAVPIQRNLIQPIILPLPKSCVKQEEEKEEEQLSLTDKDRPVELLSTGIRKKVTFDSFVKTEEKLSPGVLKKVAFDQNVKIEEQLSPGVLKKVTFDLNVKQEEQLCSGLRKKVTFASNVKEYDHVSYGEPQEITQESMGGAITVDEISCEPAKSSSVSEEGSTVSSLVSFPPNHRYRNCRESDDEDEELDCEVSDLDEDEDDEEEGYDYEYSEDEYHLRQIQEFSARPCSPVESRTQNSETYFVDDGHNDHMLNHESPERGTDTPVAFNRGARDRAGYVHSVLNPVENMAQWKTVKVKGTPLMKEQKENIIVGLSFQHSSSKSKPKLDEHKSDHDVAVDASLSAWIVTSQKTPPSKATPITLEPISSGASASPHGSNSVRCLDDRPILGALTVEELKKFSPISSPRRSPSRSPDERPLVGTVGMHWNDRTPDEDSGSVSSFKGIPNTTSKYSEDKRVNWHSTPFETRLERALNRGADEGQC